MSLLNLPNECILAVAKQLPPADLSHLILTSRHLSLLLTHLLHKYALLDHDKFTALQHAAKNGRLQLTKLLLKKGVDVNYHRNDYNNRESTMHFGTALHWAAYNGHGDIVALLLENGAEVDHTAGIGSWGRSGAPLEIAVSRGNEEVVRILLEHGATTKTQERTVPLLTKAAKGGYDGIARMLLDKGVDVNDRAIGYEKTALYEAVQNRRLLVIKLLLEKGADPGIRGPRWEKGMTPLEWAVRHSRRSRSVNSMALVKLLEEKIFLQDEVIDHGEESVGVEAVV